MSNRTMVLDCTLRDGGYYNDWDFDSSTVYKYLAAVSTAKIDVIEIGFRFLPQEHFRGAFAYSSDDYLLTLPLPSNVEVAVMVNAKELISFEGGAEKAVKELFSEKKRSPVDIVRIATHLNSVDQCHSIAKTLHALGYRVFLNLMQVDSIGINEVMNIARAVEAWDCIEALYFADSFGNMNPDSVVATIEGLKAEWHGLIGLHAHDNKGQALINSLAALENGVDYIDATLLGMGRGAGNTKTENLLVEMTQRGYSNYFPDALFPLTLQEFNALQQEYGWGPNIYYFLSAVHGIHPTYVQEMLGGELYDTEQILAAINFLKSTRAPFYNFETMLRAISGETGDENGSWDASGWMNGRDVLIIGPGPGTERHIKSICDYVERKNPIVLCLNINGAVPKEIVAAYVACHETRILIESDQYQELDKPLIIPLSRVPKTIKETLNSVEVLDFGMRIEKGGFQIEENGCVLSNSLSLMYAISVATVGGASRILLSGVDGYGATDSRHKEMVCVLEAYEKLVSARPIIAITPTTYPIKQCSVYDPSL